MRLYGRLAAVAMLFACSATVASAQGSAKNDSTDYEPRVHTVAGILPFADAYTLGVSAPTQLNRAGETAISQGMEAVLRITVASYPDGSSPAEAAALVSVDDASLVFFALGETHHTTVRVAASANTTPGDYMYNVQAVGPTGMGWGVSSHTLMVTLSEPVLLDMTPPDVRITAPVDGQAFTFCSAGTNVPVTISAVDPESLVTAIGGTVNDMAFAVQPFTPANVVTATGTVPVSAVGAYTLGAWATSAGGDGTAPEVGVSVNYAMSWLPPLAAGRTIRGAVVIKFAARDCLGAFVPDSSVRVEVWEGAALRASAVYGTGSDAVRIEDDAHYVTNFQPPSGTHTYTVKVFFNGFLQASTNVSVQ